MTGVGWLLLTVAGGVLTAGVMAGLALVRRDRDRGRMGGIDPLTRLGNRKLLTAAIQRSLSSLPAVDDHDGSCGPAVLLVDLDSFKDINDVLGHAAGDAVLVRVAAATGCRGPAGFGGPSRRRRVRHPH